MDIKLFFFFKQKTAYEMRISDWSSDVCSSDLIARPIPHADAARETALLVEDRRIEDVFRQPDQRQLEYPPRIRALHLKAALGIRIVEDDAETIERRRKRREGLGELHL